MQKSADHYINGSYVKQDNNYYAHCNPATGRITTNVAMADSAIVNQAVDNSMQAFLNWSQTSPVKRAKILFKFNELLNANLKQISHLVTEEHGKTLEDAKGSVLRGIEVVEHCCGIANLLQGSFTNNISSNIDVYTIRQPLGVCAGVSPFNFPVMVPIWLSIPAIACGNSFILKPSEKAPSAMLYIADLLKKAGLPDGVFNIVNGHKEAVDGLLFNDNIQAITAVGSSAIAEYIYKTAINNNKRSQTFGGAKNHCIVMPDADLASVADIVAGAAFGSAGERCMALSVAVIVGDNNRNNEFVNHLITRAQQIKLGSGFEDGIDMGPLISKEHLNKVLNFIEAGINENAELVFDGRKNKPTNSELADGYFLGPCIFNNVQPDMSIYKEEIFGPVLVVMTADNYNSALELINRHQYGNGSSIFTNNLNVTRDFVNKVQAGMVGVNIPIPVPYVTHSFGGWKNSIFGDLGLHGNQSIQFYTKPKSITVGLAKTGNENTLNMPFHS